MRPALLALALLLAACSDDESTVDVPDETTTSVDLSEPAPLPTVPTTTAPTAAPTTVAPATAPPQTRGLVATTVAPAPPPTQAPATYYANCDEVRAAGAAPIRRGEPGYRAGLDRDGDGIACDTEG